MSREHKSRLSGYAWREERAMPGNRRRGNLVPLDGSPYIAGSYQVLAPLEVQATASVAGYPTIMHRSITAAKRHVERALIAASREE